MTNRRTLKRCIKLICEELLAECVAASLYADKSHRENGEALLFTIIRLQNNFIARISHPEPGMSAQAYFRDLRDKFSAQTSEIIDQINNLH